MKFRSVLFATLLLLAANIVHAQLNGVDLSSIEATTPLSADEVPVVGTFYSAQNPGAPPMPGNIFGLPCWSLGNGCFLLDDLDGSGGGGFHAMDDSVPIPGEGGGGDGGSDEEFTNNVSFTFPTNGLWLWITNISDGTVYANLNGATDYVYEIFSTTNLAVGPAVTNWNIETEVFPGAYTNTMLFTVPMNGRNPLFLWARDWAGITNNGNLTPEWWFFYWFDAINLADTNVDAEGNTFYYDYQNGFDPNVIQFTFSFTNTYFTDGNIEAQLNVDAGIPFYQAVLINDTNTEDAIWEPYAGTNISFSLTSNGVYSIMIGLRGLPADATATWAFPQQVVLDISSPTLIVTSPNGGTASQPIIQLQGLVSETLSNLTFDVSNALGVVTNQQGYWNAAYFDTNVLKFTTNDFQCYDIRLANGPNVVTLHATDLEGNTATTNVSLVLDYSSDTNPPALNILWPPDGNLVSGTNFTLQAQIDDNTATVTAQITDANGDVNTVQGLVERSGTVLVNNVPLSAGTNSLMITATDAAGNSVTTNLTLVQSSVTVMMDQFTEFNQPSVSVTGTVSDPTASLTVNGSDAYFLDTNGDWEADSVPVSPVGTATFDVEIYSSSSTLEGSQTFDLPQTPVVSLMSYTANTQGSGGEFPGCYSGGGSEIVNWTYQLGGLDTSRTWGTDGDCFPDNHYSVNDLSGGLNGYTPTWENDYTVENSAYDYFGMAWIINQSTSLKNTRVMIVGSDQAVVGQTALYLVAAQVFDADTGLQLPGSDFTFMNQTPGSAVTDVTNGDGSIWSIAPVSAPAGTTPEVTPQAGGEHLSFPGMQAGTFTLTVVSNSAVQINGATNWATVENPTNYVIVQASLNTTNAALLDDLESNIVWSGGTPVTNNPLQCEVSTATSTNVTVTASLGALNASVEVWVIWSTVQILTSGTNPPDAPLQPSFGSNSNQLLGIFYNSSSNQAIGRITAVATMTPALVHTVITNGWGFTQMKWTETFVDGNYNSSESFPPWTYDGPYNGFYTNILDTDDKLYAIDGPDIGAYYFASNSVQIYKNFYIYTSWNSQVCSSTNNFWYFYGTWKVSQSPPINPVEVGNGTITMP